jgi:serine/threonine protein kinase/formylglycine-generating enzyme required for sulfatase activity/dienelactone hydrolase
MASENILPAGTKLSHYQILAPLGAGGMGEVYLAEDTKLGRKVAIKLLPAESSESENANRRLLREAQSAAKLDHPNICGILEVAEDNGRNFICMQYVEGETLDVKIKRQLATQHSFELSEALSLAVQVADALAEAHSHGTIHRDIKPSNIMVTKRGAVKVMDFGLAKTIKPAVEVASEAATEALLSSPGALIGTLPYMSPEQVRGEPLDGRSDIFSLATVLYELISGHQPFTNKSSAATASAILTHEPPPLARFAKEVPAELERIVSKALHKDPDERYQTAKDLLIDLRHLRDELDFQHRLERSAPARSGDQERSHFSGSGEGVDFRARPDTGARSSTVAGHPPPTVPEDKTTRAVSATGIAPARGHTLFSRKVLIVLAALIVAGLAGWFFWHRNNLKWARAQLPQVEQLAQAQKYYEAYNLAAAAQKYLPDDPTLTRLLPTISETISVSTDPAGAAVYLKRYDPEAKSDAPRVLAGTTPIRDLRVARGQYILYVEKQGYARIERSISGTILHTGTLVVLPAPINIQDKLLPTDQVPDRMAFVPGGAYRLDGWSRPTEAQASLNDYFIDKYEVSNQEFKEFITAGGYLKKQYWQQPFSKAGKPIAWEDALREFKDRTGLPGPRDWSNQNFPDGKADYPVTNISWYEAAAYAAFRGKQLPTIFQWEKAARDSNSSALASFMPWGFFYPGESLQRRANFDIDGPLPVNSSEFGMSPFGVYNMAGNVSEWCLNELSSGYAATGGAWGQPSYTFAEYANYPGLYSSDKVGFRCVRNAPGATGDQGGMHIELKDEIPNYTPSSDADFARWQKTYDYEKTPLDPQVVEVKETADWTRERITFNGADGQRAIAYLYLPKNYPQPFQVIHVVPAGDVASGVRSLPESMEDRIAPLIKSGRAAFGVVINGYIERLRPQGYVPPDPGTVEYRERSVNWITDVRRGLDYLETRKEIDPTRIAFFGPSAGARIGLILAAVETRYRTVVLMGAGVSKRDSQAIPEASTVNFAPHIRGPKLMVNGRYDEDTPLKTQGEPLFRLLREPKRSIIFDGGHIPPIEFLVTKMNDWFDETMGPIRRE